MDLKLLNIEFASKTPAEIVKWALSIDRKAIVSTNFRPYEAALLHACTSAWSDIPVIWCDTGYNTLQTYKHAQRTIDSLALNIKLYVPAQTAAYRDAVMGIPEIDDPRHAVFTEQVKLEPFRRAMTEHKPQLWFTNLRKGQTSFRDSIDILSYSSDGILKVAPFYHWDDEQMEGYLKEHSLEKEERYYDPTKVLGNRECGLHG